MMKLPRAIRELTETFERLPGVGPKSAQRLVFHLLHYPEQRLVEFGDRLRALKTSLVLCGECHNVSESDPCSICSDETRDRTKLCIVEQPLDVLALEKSDSYTGTYHILHGAIAPLNNIGPEQLFLHDLAARLEGVEEIILATNPTMEGEATALYIREYIESHAQSADTNIRFTRIGHGLPIGADIEYADGVTLRRALEGRRQI